MSDQRDGGTGQGDLFGARVDNRAPDATYLQGRFKLDTPLEQRTANMYGKTVTVPRLECWFGSRPYAFGGRVEPPRAFTPRVEQIRQAVSREAGVEFDSCFVNYYRNGYDCISWHADDDSWIGPVIASVSFGAARRFWMRLKNDHHTKVEWSLGDGDLLVMLAGVQKTWEHRVPREPKVGAPRLNLTFRTTVAADQALPGGDR